jgi:hypothetical protein
MAARQDTSCRGVRSNKPATVNPTIPLTRVIGVGDELEIVETRGVAVIITTKPRTRPSRTARGRLSFERVFVQSTLTMRSALTATSNAYSGTSELKIVRCKIEFGGPKLDGSKSNGAANPSKALENSPPRIVRL